MHQGGLGKGYYSTKCLLGRTSQRTMIYFIPQIGVVFFDQRLGSGHSKRMSKYAF